MRHGWIRFVSVVPATVLAVLALHGPAAAQSDDAEQIANTPPYCAPTDDDPTVTLCDAEVVVVLDIEDVVRIDERERLAEIDARLGAFWWDPRLQPGCTNTDPVTVFQGEAAHDKLKTIWWPELTLRRGVGSRDTSAFAVSVGCGFAFYEERFVAEVRQEFANLNDFPFDDHQLTFTIVPFAQGTELITFISAGEIGDLEPDEQRSSFGWETDEWSLDKEDEFESAIIINPIFEEATFEDESNLPANDDYYRDPDDPSTYYGDPEGFYPSATFNVTIDRKPTFYIYNVILPLILIVAISWAVFWGNLGGMSLAERLGVSITCLLTVVAFDFLTGDSLPKLSYTTRLDVFYNFSYVFVALTVVVSIVSAGQLRARAAAADQPVGAPEPSAIDAVDVTASEPDPEPHTGPDRDPDLDAAVGGTRRRQRTDVTRLDEVSRRVFPVTYAIAVAISLLGWLSRGRNWFDWF